VAHRTPAGRRPVAGRPHNVGRQHEGQWWRWHVGRVGKGLGQRFKVEGGSDCWAHG
jgi:hypothetical protein